jgi:biotin transport system ATP-binding protein
MIQIQNVSHSFAEREVLKQIDLDLTQKRIAIVGSNGSGKSTFVRLLNGLQLPTQGRVLVDGLDTKTHGRDVRRKVGFVFQNPDNQIVFPVVEEDLAFGMKNLKLGRDVIAARIDAVLARYGLSEFRQHPAHLLSGGQKQLLAISGVLIMEPEYVVFDEPTTLLDLRNKRRVAQAIRELDQTAIVISHDLDLLSDFERVIVFHEGKVAIDDEPSSTLKRYVEMMA